MREKLYESLRECASLGFLEFREVGKKLWTIKVMPDYGSRSFSVGSSIMDFQVVTKVEYDEDLIHIFLKD